MDNDAGSLPGYVICPRQACAVVFCAAARSAEEPEEGKGMSDNERLLSKKELADLALLDEHLYWVVGDCIRTARRYRNARNRFLPTEDSIRGQLDQAIAAAEKLHLLLDEELSEMAGSTTLSANLGSRLSPGATGRD